MGKRFSVETVFSAIDRMTAPLRKIDRSISKVTKTAEAGMKSADKILGGVGRAGTRAAGAVAAGAVVAGVALKDIVDDGAAFEQSLVNAASKFPDAIDRATTAGRARFAELTAAAMQVGGETEHSSQQAAGALDFLAKAGEQSTVAIASLSTMADFATATEVELARGTDIASDALGAFGLAVADPTQRVANYSRVMAAMTKTSNAANMGVDELFEAVVSGAKSFDTAGQEVETFLAGTELLAGSGIKGSIAGRQLKIVMRNLTSGAGAAGKALKKVKFSAVDKETGKVKDLADMIGELNVITGKMGEGARKKFLAQVLGEAEVAGAILIDAGSDRIRAIEAVTRADTDAVSRLAAAKRDTTAGDLKAMESAIASIKLGVFGVIKDDVREIVKEITEWARVHKDEIVGKMRTGLEYIRDNFDDIVASVTKFVKVGFTIWSVIKVLQVFTTVMTAVNIVMAMNPVGLVVLGIVLLIAAVAAVIVYWEDLVAWFKESDTWIQALVVGFLPFLAIPAAIIENWSGISGFFKNLWGDVSGFFSDSMREVVSVFKDTAEWLNNATGKQIFDTAGWEVVHDNRVTERGGAPLLGDVMSTEPPATAELASLPPMPVELAPAELASLPPMPVELAPGVPLPPMPAELKAVVATIPGETAANVRDVLPSIPLPPPPAPGVATEDALASLARASGSVAQASEAEPPRRPESLPEPREAKRDTLEVTIRDQSGAAAVTGGTLSGKTSIQRTGSF